MKNPAPARCEQHKAAPGWQCTECNHVLCPDCTALKSIPPITMIACGRCGELAEPLMRKKSESASLAERLPGAFKFPFAGEGLPAWLGISMFLWLGSLLGTLGSLIAWGITMASLFGLTRSTARGGDHIELSDFQDPITSIMMPLVRFALVTLPAWGGLLLAMYTGKQWLVWASLAISVLWSPTAYIGAAAGASVVHMLNPLRVLGSTARLGKDYGVYLAGIIAVIVTIVITQLLALVVRTYVVVPIIGGVMAQMVSSYGPFVGARLAGLVLMLHGPVFGWGEENELYEPVLGDTQPRGELPKRESTLPRHLPSAIELEPEAPPSWQGAAPVHDRFAAIELDPNSEAPPEVAPLDVALLPTFSEQSAQTIRQAIQSGKADVALDGFRSTGLSSAEQLSFDELMWLGQTAASHIDYESAELAFRKAAERKEAPESLGRARVMLARLLAERLNRKDDATGWMRRVLAEQPGTSAATYAEKWLGEKGA
jgi:hypothetical protein